MQPVLSLHSELAVDAAVAEIADAADAEAAAAGSIPSNLGHLLLLAIWRISYHCHTNLSEMISPTCFVAFILFGTDDLLHSCLQRYFTLRNIFLLSLS